MLITLALFAACTQDTDGDRTIATPPPRNDDEKNLVSSVPVAMPAGRAVVRECYASPERERSVATAPPTGGPGYGTKTTATRSAPKSAARAPTTTAAPMPIAAAPPASMAPASAPAAEPAAKGMEGLAGASQGATSGGGLGNTARRGDVLADGTTSLAEAPAKPMPPPADAARSEADDAPKTSRTKDKTATTGEAAVKEDRRQNEEKASAKKEMYTPDADEEANAKLDWGATVYLSNDDSMSLASAQRLLWALQNKAAVTASQIRPHEFLNYFSFDTAPFANNDVFSVAGSAEMTDNNTLTMAFAVKGYTPPRQPLDLTLVIDRSGSMYAEGRMEYLKRGLEKMTTNLKPGDRVDLVLFDHEVCTPLEDYVVGRDDPSLWSSAVSALTPRGSTNISIGLKEGYRIATGRDGSGRNPRMMLITDANVNTGDVNPDTVSEIGRAYDEHGIAFTGIGVGRDFNDTLLNKITEKGKGAYVYLGSEAVVDRIFGVGFDSLVQNIAHDVHFSVDLPDSLAMERFYGEEASTTKADIQPINYYAGSSQLFLQDLKVRGGRPASSDEVTFTAEWRDPDTNAARTQTWTTTIGALMAADQHNLRKARALMAWTDMLTVRAVGGGSPCSAPFSLWKDRVSALGDDAEIAWLDGLTRPLCGESAPPPPPPVAAGVAYKVKVDSDMPIAEVQLACPNGQQKESLSGSDTVATFTAAPGSCTLTLQGTVPMTAAVTVPVTGGDVRCLVRGGRLSCS